MRPLYIWLLLTVSALAWVPPIGIPAPDWGGTIGNPIETVAPTPPSPWTGNVPNVYFVQTGGTNPNEGYPGNPRNDIPLTLPAGSVVFVNGTYTTDHGTYLIRYAGTAANPCWILSYNPASPAVATGSWTFNPVGGNPSCYTIVDGINWDWSATGGHIELKGSVNHLCIRNCNTLGAAPIDPGDPNYGNSVLGKYNSTAVLVQSSGSLTVNPTEQIVFSGNNFQRGGCWQYADSETDPDAHGISAGFPIKDMWIVDTSFSYFSGNAVQLASGSNGGTLDTDMSQRQYIGRCTADHIAQQAFWTKRSDTVIMSGNTVDTLRRDCPSTPNSCGFGGQYGPKNLWIIYNTVSNCQNGITLEAGTDPDGTHTNGDVYLIGNVIYNIHDENDSSPNWRGNGNTGAGTSILLRGGIDAYIVNNTISDFDAGILSPNIGGNRYVEGNILSNRSASVDGADIMFEYDDADLTTIASNIIQQNSGACWVRNGAATYTTVAALNAAKGPSNITTVPTFTNAGSGDYSLASGSSGIDAFGPTEHAVYGVFQTAYGRSIFVDRNGGERPHGSQVDIGAYEFGSTPTDPPEAGTATATSVTVSGTLTIGN